MSLADELAKLDELKKQGALSDVEYQKAKDRLLDPGAGATPGVNLGAMTQPTTWSMLIHLSKFCGYIGAIKANDGVAWPYPMSIRFFAIDGPRAGEP
jgi:hypothetical protein